MAFALFSEYQKYGKNDENIGKKVFWRLDIIPAQLGQFTTSDCIH